MTWKRLVVTGVCWLSVGGWIGSSFLGATRERRFILYGLVRELKPGMTKGEAQAAVQRHQAPFIKYHEEPSKIVLTVELLPVQYLDLCLHFEQDKLVKTGFVGEDGPEDVPRDAPKLE